ncbi:N-terminal domain of NEFA-interacting nuclear protein NIP30-domain-containing protein [Corynascus novoguineensis]|uniref:N-terminal domain of NEFA-interacting nuclear protein NIP30-domain-containing protein n=1 Tax=Corynascus novoguineensis TaxID=1126955 RepID=A0AAN7D2L5_9PEZI|nr:N-terminal domain of NEFA-interacting nuclear protein NIP30-domain-containing protein [Corynascus novoguineensis]
MSSRFISAGAINAATGEEAKSSPASTQPTTSTTTTGGPSTSAASAKSAEKQAAWAAASAQLEADRLRRREQQQRQQSSQEKSLYEVLQANKAAKQAAFEEAHRLRNQFRALDDDEVEFLDEVRARRRREEEEARREVEKGLEAFREAQKNGLAAQSGSAGEDHTAGDELNDEEEERVLLGEFGFGVAGRKRRRGEVGKEKKRVKGVNAVKRVSTGGGGDGVEREATDRQNKDGEKYDRVGGQGELGENEAAREPSAAARGKVSTETVAKAAGPTSTSTTPTSGSASGVPASTSITKPGGLLVDYGSDDDED